MIELGEELMDGEHAAQLRYMDAFEKALRAGESKVDMVICLDRLVEFTNLHFISEQILMQEHGYPAIAKHAEEHERLLEQVRKMQAMFNQGDQSLTEQELAMLRDWLIHHIGTTDKTFVQWLNSQKGADESGGAAKDA